MAKTHCEVCVELFNLSSRKRVICPYCEFRACVECAERFICESSDDPHCMSCKHGFNLEVLTQNLTKKFLTSKYKNRREEILYDREKSKMPETQPYVEISVRIKALKITSEQIHCKLICAQNKLQTLCLAGMNYIGNFEGKLALQEEYHFMKKECGGLSCDHTFILLRISELTNHLTSKSVEREKKIFIRACANNSCHGFLGTDWSCGLCSLSTCKTCHEMKEDGHTCLESNILTARLLAHDSRGCPKCASMIFKISGCDQMYCTQCHTAFSWKTGRIENGIVHNPHFFEYNRAQGNVPRQPGDVVCGGFPDWRNYVYLLLRSLKILESSRSYALFSNAYRSYGHCRLVLIPKYTSDANDNRDIRIKFMIKDIDLFEFKKKIQQREKARNRKLEIRQVLDMYSTVLMDIFQKFVGEKDPVEFITSVTTLVHHVNMTFTQVSNRFTKCVVPHINQTFDFAV